MSGNKNPQPRRNRVFSLLTLIVAIACIWATGQAADYVKHLNTARLVGAAMTGGFGRSESSPQATTSLSLDIAPRSRPNALPGLPGSWMPTDQAPSKEALQTQPNGDLRKQTVYVEGIVLVWQLMMYSLAGCLVLVGIVSLLTHRARLLHLVAAGLIGLATIGTLIGMVFLGDVSKGGFEQVHPLPMRMYVYVAVVQVSYAVVLLAVFAGRPKTTLQG